MPARPNTFARLLTEAVHRIRLQEGSTVQVVQDELGYALDRQGGSAIEYWRKGHVPPQDADVARLARLLVRRGSLEPAWLLSFLASAGYPEPRALHESLFPEMSPPPARAAAAHPQLEPAPFVAGPPITHPRGFFGREQELRRIFGLLRRFPLQNAAVIGARRSGKTSLLHYLRTITTASPDSLRPGQFQEWLPEPAAVRWVFIDFQDPRLGTLDGLLPFVLEGLALPVPAPCSLSAFMDAIADHLTGPAVLLLDEIGAALAAPQLDIPFWWALRSLQTNHARGLLGFVLAAHEPPAQLADAMDKTSPFFNIFGHSLQLGPLQEGEARALIASAPRPFAPADVDWILATSRRWPAPLQTLCHARLAALEEGQAGEGWKALAVDQLAPYQELLHG